MKKRILIISMALVASQGISANSDTPQELPLLKNKWVNAAAFPLFAATAYYFFDEAGESYDQIKIYVRNRWNKNKKNETAAATKGQDSWLTQAAQAVSKKILRKRTRKELLLKELDKQSYYLTGAVGTTIITWFLRNYLPEVKSFLYIGEKS